MAKRTTLVAFTSPVTYVALLSAGKSVFLHFPVSGNGTPKITIHVWSKAEGDGPFYKVCDRSFAANDLPVALEIENPLRLPGSIWRLELTVDAQSGTEIPPTPLEVFRTVGSDFDAESSQQKGSWLEAEGLLCLGGDLYESFSSNRSSVGFAGRLRVDVNTGDDKMRLSPTQREGLNTLILEGISLWVSGCRECRIEHLVAVRIGTSDYVRKPVDEWYRKEFLSRGAKATHLEDLEESLRDHLESKILLRAGPYIHEATPRRKEFSSYTLEPAGSFRVLCRTNPDVKQTPLLWNVREALCFPEGMPKGSLASIRVRFRTDGQTACGTSPNIIACRADTELTEFNIRDFQFTFPKSAAPPIGDGLIEVDLLHVLMHEIGHWIGLRHIDIGHSIMASSMDRSRCVDLPTMLTLARFNSATPEEEEAVPMAFTLTTPRGRMRRPNRRR